MWRPVLLGVALAVGVSGCASHAGQRCESSDRYATSGSAPPLRIPDDLAPPDQSGALRIPLEQGNEADGTVGGCLEAPPPYEAPQTQSGAG